MSKSASPMFMARMTAGPMSQTQLAKKVGVTQSLISRIEKGQIPDLTLARKIAKALRKTVDEIFPPEPPAPVKTKKRIVQAAGTLEAVS